MPTYSYDKGKPMIKLLRIITIGLYVLVSSQAHATEESGNLSIKQGVSSEDPEYLVFVKIIDGHVLFGETKIPETGGNTIVPIVINTIETLTATSGASTNEASGGTGLYTNTAVGTAAIQCDSNTVVITIHDYSRTFSLDLNC